MFSPVVYLKKRTVLSQDAFNVKATVNGFVLLQSKQFFYFEKGALLHSPSVVGFVDPGFQGHLCTVVRQNHWEAVQRGVETDLAFVIEVLKTEPMSAETAYQGTNREVLPYNPVAVNVENTLEWLPYDFQALGKGTLLSTPSVPEDVVGRDPEVGGYSYDLSTKVTLDGVRVLNPISVPKGYRVLLIGRSRSFRNGYPIVHRVLLHGRYNDLVLEANTEDVPATLLTSPSLVQALVFKA